MLETVIERIRQQVAHYGYARLAGLGTFRGQNGSVSFEPDPGLAESVNLRFAGLNDLQVDVSGTPPSVRTSQIEVEEDLTPTESPWADEVEPAAPALRDEFPMPGEDIVDRRWREEPEWTEEEEPESMAPPEYDEEEAVTGEYEELELLEPEDSPGEYSGVESSSWADEPNEELQPSWGPDEESQSDLPEEADEESGVTWQDTAQDKAEHPLGPRSPDQFEEADYSFIVDRERSTEVDAAWVPLGEHETVEEEPAPLERETTPKAPDRSALHHDRIRREPYGGRAREAAPAGRTGVWIGAAVVLVIAAAAVAYFVFRPVEPQSTSLIDQAPVAMTDSAAMALDTSATQPDVTAVVPDGAEDERVESEPPVREPPAESTPLRSAEGIDSSRGGYTIVVYSETSSGPAEQTAQRFRNEGYRTGVLQSRDGGVTRYRVGVGQFRSAGEATRARDSLAGKEIPEDAWVYRIR